MQSVNALKIFIVLQEEVVVYDVQSVNALKILVVLQGEVVV